MTKGLRWTGILGLVLVAASPLLAQGSFRDTVGPVKVGPVTSASPLRVPFITWGGDMATFHANGGLRTKPGSLFHKQGLDIELVPGDDFVGQVKDYLAGKSPFLRGTFRMVGLAAEAIGQNPGTQGMTVLQLTWSAGDHLIGRSHIRTLADLKGKTLALQKAGPHVGMLDDILHDAQLGWDDVKVVWAKDLTASDDSPAALFRATSSIDACFAITPDMIGLTGGLESSGTGAEGTVGGARVVVSTAQLSRSIADVYVCRKDFFEANKELVTRFVAAYLRACEEVLALKREYEGGKGSPGYMALLKMTQDIYSKEVIPTLEDDAHGLLSDCTFVGYPGNWKFFKWRMNVTGFDRFLDKALDLATSRGYAGRKVDLLPSALDYDSPLFGIVEDKTRPQEGAISEIFSFEEEEVGDAIVSFTINFEPNQIDFSTVQYASDFKRAIEMSARFGNAAFIIKGHSDPTLTLKTLVEAGVEKGYIKVSGSARDRRYFFNGRPLDLDQVGEVVKLIESGAFDGVADSNPRQIMQAARNLSLKRAQNVRDSLVAYARANGYTLDKGQFQAEGAGISEPLIPKPRSMSEARENMRVEFRLVKVDAEIKGASDFDY